MTVNKIDEVLRYAIEKEQEAHDFYLELAKKMDRIEMKDTFLQFAREELGHKAKLEAALKEHRLRPSPEKVLDLRIADYLVEVDPAQELDFARALILAMQREKAAFRLYTDLARASEDPEVKLTFLSLAQEEAKHKLRFEIEYDEVVLVEN